MFISVNQLIQSALLTWFSGCWSAAVFHVSRNKNFSSEFGDSPREASCSPITRTNMKGGYASDATDITSTLEEMTGLLWDNTNQPTPLQIF